MKQEFKKQTLTKEQLAIPEDGLIHLHDLTFDFKDYFARYDELSEEEQNEFQCRVMGLFCKEFFESGGDPSAISPWVASYIANAFFQVLAGAPFNQVLPTPFEPRESSYTPKGERAINTYCVVQNAKNDVEGVSDILRRLADHQNVSYETVRGDYYKVKNSVDAGKGFPDKFLKNDANF